MPDERASFDDAVLGSARARFAGAGGEVGEAQTALRRVSFNGKMRQSEIK